MIGPETTIREVYAIMETMHAACIRITLDDSHGKPLQGMVFTDGPKVTAKIMGAAKIAQDTWERESGKG